METVHVDGSPLAAYLEGSGTCDFDSASPEDQSSAASSQLQPDATDARSFAPSADFPLRLRSSPSLAQALRLCREPSNLWSRLHRSWSSAVNSRLSRADNARFIERFRYVIVASQLLNEYLDHGSVRGRAAQDHGVGGGHQESSMPDMSTSLYGAALTAGAAFALAYLIHWGRSSQAGHWNRGRAVIAFTGLILVILVGYGFVRRHWLSYLRENSIAAASRLTINVESLELSFSAGLSFIQEVELVSKGYKISSPLPPASRIETQSSVRRCSRLRKTLHSAYTSMNTSYAQTCTSLRTLINLDDLERYFDVYDIASSDAAEALAEFPLGLLEEDDPQSLKSLRLLSYRSSLLRRVLLCSLMSLDADGGRQDFYRWRLATAVMDDITKATAASTDRVRGVLDDMESVDTPTPPPIRADSAVVWDRARSQVRKISLLSSGIRGLQAKMHLLREETVQALEQSEDPAELSSSLMAQYDSIGADMRELIRAWEAGRASIQSNLNRQDYRSSMASSGPRSTLSSLGGLTAVEDAGATDGTPADALRTLSGEVSSQPSNRSSMATTNSDEEIVYEAVALPRGVRRSLSTRDERIARMHEDRERQAAARARREANTSMLRELESVINLRPKNRNTTGMSRITSV